MAHPRVQPASTTRASPDDGRIDYSSYSLRELEEALAGINPRKYPENHARLRAAYERLNTSLPPAPETGIQPPDVEEDEGPPRPRYDEQGRYIPNEIPLSKRAYNLALSLFLLAYGVYGAWAGDLYLPARRSQGVHLLGIPAWIGCAGIVCVCIGLLAAVLDHYDRRDNEDRYRGFQAWTGAFGCVLLVVAVLWSVGTT